MAAYVNLTKGFFLSVTPLNILYTSIYIYLFRQNTYLQNKKHMLTCQGGDWLL